MKLLSSLFVVLFFTLSAFSQALTTWQDKRPPNWSYDPGPNYFVGQNPENAMAKELIDLYASIPYFPAVAKQIRTGGKKKFRPAYGPIPWRMILEPNSVKILFIGQDGTHVAEAANRPATAGFGGRAQDLAAFFGVEYSAAFINTFAFTITGQYAARFAPYMKNGEFNTQGSITPNDVWLMAQDQRSPIVKWRNKLIDWIIRNNKDSLKMIVLFGGSAKDSIATYIESRGGKVSSFNERNMNNIQVPLFKMTYSGGNNQFPVPQNKLGKDLYKELMPGLDYAHMSRGSKDQQKAMRYGKQNSNTITNQMVFTKKGPYKNGLIHHAQFGGYDLNKIYVNDRNKPTRSLKGLKLSDGSQIDQDLLVVALPHPTYLSNVLIDNQNQKSKELYYQAGDEYYFNKLYKKFSKAYKKKFNSEPPAEFTPQEVARRWASKKKADKLPVTISNGRMLKSFFDSIKKSHPNKTLARDISNKAYEFGVVVVGDLVEKDVSKLRPYAKSGWNIPADRSDNKHKNINRFAKTKNNKYRYGRSDIHNVYYDFGTPKNRMVSQSSASRLRLSGDLKKYGQYVIVFGSRDKPSYEKQRLVQLLNHPPNQPLDPNQMFVAKVSTPEGRYIHDPGPSKTYAKYLKNFSLSEIYKTNKPDVNDLDKDGNTDEIMNFRDHGISAYYVQSHPDVGDFGHYRGTFENPKAVILADPAGYDDIITSRALTGTRGQYLQGLMEDKGIYDEYLVLKTVPFGMDGATAQDWEYVLDKTKSYREKVLYKLLKENNVEHIIADGPWAQKELARIVGKLKNQPSIQNLNRNVNIEVPQMRNIPKSHLTYYARAWEGTAGDRVLNTTSLKQKGMVFIEVAPPWALERQTPVKPKTQKSIDQLLDIINYWDFPKPKEKIPDYLNRQQKEAA